MCRAHAGVRHLVSSLLDTDEVVVILDMEAGLEHLSRGTERHVDQLLVVMEPYFKSLETGRRAAELGCELGIPRIDAVANKLRDGDDAAAIRGYADEHGLSLLAEIPYDDAVRRADLAGRAPIDTAGSSAVQAVSVLADRLGY